MRWSERNARAPGRGVRTGTIAAVTAAFLGLLAGCEPAPLVLPTVEQVEAAYPTVRNVRVEMAGNVAEVRVFQPTAQLRRGGTLWAKVGPYVYLFSEETRGLFESYNGLAGVRVITTSPSGREIARALLARDELTDVLWRRALNIAGLARRDGSQSPSRVEELVRWGEDHTDFEYSSRYVR